jgi:nitrogen fixation negative regulator NifL
MLGYQPAEYIGLNVFEVDWGEPEAMKEGITFFRELIQQPAAVQTTQIRIRHIDSSWHWLEATAYNLLDEPTVQAIVTTLRDISERKQAAAAIQASQQLAQSTIDSLRSHICVLNDTGTVVAVNKSWTSFAAANDGNVSSVGVGANYFLACNRAQGPDRRQAQEFAAGIQAVMVGREEHFEMEYGCHSPIERRWFVGRVTPFQTTTNIERRWVVVTHENITVRKLAEEHLRLRSAALEAAANAIVITDVASHVEWINPAFTALTGYTAEEAVGNKLSELVKSGEHDNQFYKEMWNAVLAGEIWYGELVNRRKDGTTYIEEQTITPLVSEDGTISHFISIKQDITERKRAENERIRLLEQVQEQAQHIEQIMNTVPEGVVLFDAECNVLLSNPVAKENLEFLTDYEPDQPVTYLAGRPLDGFFTPLSHNAAWHEITLSGKTFEVTARQIERPVKLQEEKQWVMMINDVTQQREYQRHLQAQEQMAIVGQLAAGIAHDFNNIMSVISIYSEILQEIEHLTDKERRQLNAIYAQSQHAVALIQQILDFSRRALLEKIAIDLGPLVKELVKLLERTLPTNITLNLRYSENEFIIFGDPTRLQQLLMNLALNARDAMPRGGELTFSLSSLETKVENQPLPQMTPGMWLKLTVSDTGEGIAPENTDHIFEPFFTTKQPGQGTGLGLAQVYGIVMQHEGFITFETAVGEGTEFIIYFALFKDHKAVEKETSHLETLPQGNETILVVEENLAMRFTLVDSLSELNYQVLTAESGKDALTLLGEAHQDIDLIITDWLMPDMDGAYLKSQVVQHKPETKLMIITGYPLDSEAGSDLLEKDIPWMSKPFDLATLAYKLRMVLDVTNETAEEAEGEDD